MKRLTGFELLMTLSVLIFSGCGGGGQRQSTPVTCISVACGGTDGGAGSTPGSASLAPLALVITDNPPAGVTVLSFSIIFTSVELHDDSADAVAPNVPLISGPVQIELKSLEAESALLSTGSIPVVKNLIGGYSRFTATFSTPRMTILNLSGATFGSCPNGAICEITPSLSLSSVTVSGSPFPLNVTANTLTELVLDFDLNNSISGSFSVNPIIKVSARTFSGGVNAPPIDTSRNLFGRVTSIVRNFIQGPTFFPESPLTITLATDSLTYKFDIADWTTYQGFGGSCDDSNTVSESCFAIGQMWEANLQLRQNGSVWGTWVQLKSANQNELKVLIAAIPAPDHLDAIVLQEKPDLSGVEIGSKIDLHLLPGASFGLGGDVVPLQGFTFAGVADLLPGQVVDVRLTSPPSSAPLTADADQIHLRTTSLTATVTSKLDAVSFAVGSLPGIFSNAQVSVITSTNTIFENVVDVNSLNVGDTVSLSGQLFKTTGGPVLAALRVRKR